MGLSSPVSAAILEKKHGKIFSRVLYVFFKKISVPKSGFFIKIDYTLQKDKNEEQTEEVTLVWESMLKLLPYLN